MSRLSQSGDLTKWQRAVRMRHMALERAARDMGNVPLAFLSACRSADAFAKFENAAMEIEAIGSRNTLFKHADDLLSSFAQLNGCTGRQYLDNFRRRIYKAYLATPKKRQGKASEVDKLRHRFGELEHLLSNTQKAMVAQSTAYVALLSDVAAISRDSRIGELSSRRLSNLLNEHDEKFAKIFAPEVFATLRPDNVTSI
ncbi:hypothetical protein SAMN05192549_12517 [Duganella sacchari]|uniref:Uncharacterized protein n=1 Tax=Duganella sacchari TaxID=551987 RepID=A0A1M7RES5_9BURK|nr:hypothetical protein [Duganella sacchari]SHN44734.1 hypothetical protein SAMN05192549_12517 [Duganella sacchari]